MLTAPHGEEYLVGPLVLLTSLSLCIFSSFLIFLIGTSGCCPNTSGGDSVTCLSMQYTVSPSQADTLGEWSLGLLTQWDVCQLCPSSLTSRLYHHIGTILTILKSGSHSYKAMLSLDLLRFSSFWAIVESCAFPLTELSAWWAAPLTEPLVESALQLSLPTSYVKDKSGLLEHC